MPLSPRGLFWRDSFSHTLALVGYTMLESCAGHTLPVLEACFGSCLRSNTSVLPFLTEDRWSSYCLSSLAAQNICTSKLHCSAPSEHADPAAGPLGSTSCCSLLRGLASGCSAPLHSTPVCNPNKAVFTVDAKTTEVFAAV